MDTMTGAVIIGGICVLVLLIGALKKSAKFVIQFILRAGMGLTAIFFINQGILTLGYTGMTVGLNLVSLLTCGILGFPGLVLLYGIIFCKML